VKKGLYTSNGSSLYWRVIAVHYISEEKNYVKLKMEVFHKDGWRCLWICPWGPKNFKLRLDAAKRWIEYSK